MLETLSRLLPDEIQGILILEWLVLHVALIVGIRKSRKDRAKRAHPSQGRTDLPDYTD